MGKAKNKSKKMLPDDTPHDADSRSQRVPTTALRIAALVLDTLPFPGAGAVARPILDAVEGINVSAHSNHSTPHRRSFTYIVFAANQKSRHDAQVIADLDRQINYLVRVLEPISKMNKSQVSPDLSADTQALIRYIFSPKFGDLPLI
jgi:hypothetical protein